MRHHGDQYFHFLGTPKNFSIAIFAFIPILLIGEILADKRTDEAVWDRNMLLPCGFANNQWQPAL
jgi:hypothetical protein